MMDKRVEDPEQVRRHLISKVAWLYYHDELTQVEIAEKLGLSRVTINRLIKEARENGIVEIKVHTEYSDSFERSRQLCECFGLRDAVVVEEARLEEEDPRLKLAAAVAEVIDQHLQKEMTVGLGIGRTISSIPDYFQPSSPTNCNFIGLTGGLDLHLTGIPHTFDTISRLARLTGGNAIYIPAPSYVMDEAARKVIMEERSVVAALEIAAGCQMAVFSVGALDYSALLYEFKQISAQDLKELRSRQVVGDLLGHFFDCNGQELDTELNRRVIGLKIEQLKQIPLKILAAGGENKREAIAIALQNKLCDILVTDILSATWLLSTAC